MRLKVSSAKFPFRLGLNVLIHGSGTIVVVLLFIMLISTKQFLQIGTNRITASR